jgi:hypothetical protein
MRERPTIDVVAAPGGWPTPWPNVAELSDQLPTERWTLVGGLMVQLHAVHHRVGAIRPTNDVDIVLHVETSRGVPAAAADVLESLGYRLTTPVDPRNKTVHRCLRTLFQRTILHGNASRARRVLKARPRFGCSQHPDPCFPAPPCSPRSGPTTR